MCEHEQTSPAPFIALPIGYVAVASCGPWCTCSLAVAWTWSGGHLLPRCRGPSRGTWPPSPKPSTPASGPIQKSLPLVFGDRSFYCGVQPAERSVRFRPRSPGPEGDQWTRALGLARSRPRRIRRAGATAKS